MPRSLIGFGTTLLLVCLLLSPTRVESQCMVASTTVGMGPSFTYVIKYLNGTYNCRANASMSVSLCAPGPTSYKARYALTASAPTTAVSPSCGFICTGTGGGTCGSITIESSDGLPVELMEFSVGK